MQVDQADTPTAAAGPAQQPQQPQQQQQQTSDAAQQQQQQSQQRGGRCKYTPLPRVIKVPGAPASQLTALNIDKTSLLEQVIARYHSKTSGGSSSSKSGGGGSTAAQQRQQQQQSVVEGLEVVGELQFAFIAFVFGQSLEGA